MVMAKKRSFTGFFRPLSVRKFLHFNYFAKVSQSLNRNENCYLSARNC